MRMWRIKPHLLCTKHLYGEHVEMHMFVGSINKGVCVDGYTKTGLLDPYYIPARHASLVREIARRGGNHKSELPPIDWDMYSRNNSWPINTRKINVSHNVCDLMFRCPNCRTRILRELETIIRNKP